MSNVIYIVKVMAMLFVLLVAIRLYMALANRIGIIVLKCFQGLFRLFGCRKKV